MLQQFLLKQVKKLQEDMLKIQEELSVEELQGSSGGGLVKARITGMGELKDITIQPQAINPEEPEILEDLVTAAVRDAIEQAAKRRAERFQELTGGLPIPGLF